MGVVKKIGKKIGMGDRDFGDLIDNAINPIKGTLSDVKRDAGFVMQTENKKEKMREQAALQETAARKATANQQQAFLQSAEAAADQQAGLAARAAADQAAKDAVSAPLETAEVELGTAASNTYQTRKSKRSVFGRQSPNTGVSI